MLVGAHGASAGELHAGRFQVEAGHVWAAAGGHEHGVGRQALLGPVHRHRHERLVRPVVDAPHVRPADHADAARLEAGQHGRGYLGILARQELLAVLHDRDLGAEVRIQRGELYAYVAAADDDQALGQRAHVEQRLAHVHARAVDAGDGRHERAGARVHEHLRGLDGLPHAVRPLHLQVRRVNKGCRAVHHLHVRQVGQLMVVLAAQQAGHAVLLVDGRRIARGALVERAALSRRERRGVHERLRGDAGHVDAGAAVPLRRLLNQRHRLARCGERAR